MKVDRQANALILTLPSSSESNALLRTLPVLLRQRPVGGLFVRDLVLQAAAFPFVRNWMTRRFVSDQFDLPAYPN